ncbi:MAG: rhodanese-like domain-containing protein [Saprospiraceae bacterium]
MKNMIYILFSVLIMSACQNISTENQQVTNGVFETISKVDFEKKMKEKIDHILIDVRTPSEFQAGTIGNAKNINWNDTNFATEISKLEKNKPLFIFCQKGGRSGKALKKIKRLGFQEVYDLKGGYGDWKN